ncbi:MAG: hypothetical protein ACI3XA_04655 [Clostridia bacterium]
MNKRFKEARDKAMQIMAEEKEKEAVPALDDTPVEDETPLNENPVAADMQEEPTEEVPADNENLPAPESEAGKEMSDTEEAVDVNALKGEVENLRGEIEKLTEENSKLKEALKQGGDLAKEGVVAACVDDGDNFDFSAFIYGDENEKKDASGKLMENIMSRLRKEAAPIIQEADAARYEADMAKAIKLLSSMEEDFPGFGGKVDALNALIGRNEILKAHKNPMEQMITAYIMNAGLEAIEKGKTGMSVDELMDLYRKNDEFRGAVEKERISNLDTGDDIPPVPVGGSFSSAEPYTAPEPPKTMEEARKLVDKMFRKKG